MPKSAFLLSKWDSPSPCTSTTAECLSLSSSPRSRLHNFLRTRVVLSGLAQTVAATPVLHNPPSCLISCTKPMWIYCPTMHIGSAARGNQQRTWVSFPAFDGGRLRQVMLQASKRDALS